MDHRYKDDKDSYTSSWLVVLLVFFLLLGGVGLFTILKNTNNSTNTLAPLNSSNSKGGFIPGVGGGPVTDLTPTETISPNQPSPTISATTTPSTITPTPNPLGIPQTSY